MGLQIGIAGHRPPRAVIQSRYISERCELSECSPALRQGSPGDARLRDGGLTLHRQGQTAWLQDRIQLVVGARACDAVPQRRVGGLVSPSCRIPGSLLQAANEPNCTDMGGSIREVHRLVIGEFRPSSYDDCQEAQCTLATCVAALG